MESPTLVLEYIANLLTYVLDVPLVEQVLHRNNVADAFRCVDVIHNGNILNAKAVKFFLQKLSYDQAITPKSGMIFYDEVSDLTLLGKCYNLGENRSCQIYS